MPPLKNTPLWLVALAVVGGAAAAFYFWPQIVSEELQPPPAPPTVAESGPPAEAEPQIRHPIPEAQTQEPDKPLKPLPPLAESDAAMQDTATGLSGKEALEKFFNRKDLARRFVVTVDNLPRKKVPQRYSLTKPVAGKFLATEEQEGIVIKPENYQRYTPYVQFAETIDTKKLVAMYVYFYPLLQEEYRNQGQPTRYFNDRLVQTIDNLLAAPDVQGPVKLDRPEVLYQYADPALEARSAGQKIMIRMGSENAARIKAKLKEIRQELTGQAPKR